jgi:hypothetical protein
MSNETRISVSYPSDEKLNGLGMMLVQYLEQNFQDFEYKVEEALRLKGSVAVEVEKGISTSIIFNGNEIRISNGIVAYADLHLSGSYLTLTKVLTGQVSPFSVIINKTIKLRSLPRHPWRSYNTLKFLKLPPELLLEPKPGLRIKHSHFIVIVLTGVIGLTFLIILLLKLFT